MKNSKLPLLADDDKQSEPKEVKPNRFRTLSGYSKWEVVSALIKCIRRGYEEQALFWAYELENDEFYLWKRLAIMCSEDIGLGNPNAVVEIASLKKACEMVAQDSGAKRLFIAQAVVYLCRSPKNRMMDYVVMEHFEKRAKGWRLDIPDFAIDKHTAKGKALGRDNTFFLNDSSLENNVNDVPPLVRFSSDQEQAIELKLSAQIDDKMYRDSVADGQNYVS